MDPNGSQQNFTPAPAQSDVPVPAPKKQSKIVIYLLVGIALLVALAIALMIALLTKDKNDSQTKTSDNVQTTQSATQAKTSQKDKDIVTVPTANSDTSVTITGLHKSGDTLTVNYRLNYSGADDGQKHSINAYNAGIYTTGFRSVGEPYLIDNSTGQKYGLIKDDAGEPLASQDARGYVTKNQGVSGYVTLTLPPSNSKFSLSLGGMPLIPDLSVTY